MERSVKQALEEKRLRVEGVRKAAEEKARRQELSRKRLEEHKLAESERLREREEYLGLIYGDLTLTETAQQSSEEEQVFECVLCNKTFKFLKTLKNHESSKKHLEQLTLYAAMDQFEVDDLLSESLEEVGVDPGASLVEKVVEDEEEGEIILSGSRKKRVESRSKAVEVETKLEHQDDEEDLEELVTKHLEQLNVSSEDERLAKGKKSKSKKTKSTQEEKSKIVSESRDEKKSLSDCDEDDRRSTGKKKKSQAEFVSKTRLFQHLDLEKNPCPAGKL